MTSAEARELLADPHTSPAARDAISRQLSSPSASPARPTGLAALRGARVPGRMTKTENLYALRLEQQKDAGLIRSWKYEPASLKLDNPDEGRAITYRPDFMLWMADGRIVMDEVKGGFMADKGILKFRFAVQQYPELHFRMWQWKGSVWSLLRESEGYKNCRDFLLA